MRYAYLINPIHVALALCAMVPFAANGSTLTAIYGIPGFNDGDLPNSGLTELGGKYYGTTALGGKDAGGTYGGVLYSIDANTGAYAVVHYFTGGSDGYTPAGSLTFYQGKLYGATSSGGANGGGVVFSVDPTTGTEAVAGSLPADVDPYSNLTVYQGRLYGTGQTSIFSFDPVSGTGRVEYMFPSAGSNGFSYGNLTVVGSFLYGTAYSGGASGDGTLFRFDPSTDTLALEHSFGAGQDGKTPTQDLVDVGGIIYGTTIYGGNSGNGTIFSLDPSSGAEATIYSFSNPDVISPVSGLLAYGGLLYGQTQAGSKYGAGALYAFNPANSAVSVLRAFPKTDQVGGLTPALSLLGGIFWGVRNFGGLDGYGSVFSVDPASGHLTFHHQFNGPQRGGASGLTRVNDNLFGTSVAGGAYGLGSIYKVNPVSAAGATLYSFQGIDGQQPMAPVTDVDGVLYGTTSTGISADGQTRTYGTLFGFNLKNGSIITLANFDNAGLGGYPAGPLAAVGGALFGTTRGGGANSSGTIFKLDLSTSQLTTVADFPKMSEEGANGLIAANGLLYGTTSGGGTSDKGSIFSFDPWTGNLTTLLSFAGGTEGANPMAALSCSNGLLYGSTSGSDDQIATIFSFDPATNTKTILHSLRAETQIEAQPTERGRKLYTTFPVAKELKAYGGGIVQTDPVNGRSTLTFSPGGAVANPASSLLQTNGALFGTTISGTTDNAGTVFKFIP